jgi:hypothetical protein
MWSIALLQSSHYREEHLGFALALGKRQQLGQFSPE